MNEDQNSGEEELKPTGLEFFSLADIAEELNRRYDSFILATDGGPCDADGTDLFHGGSRVHVLGLSHWVNSFLAEIAKFPNSTPYMGPDPEDAEDE